MFTFGRSGGYVNAVKARLDKIWLHQAVKFDFAADLTGRLPETDQKEK